ncbi:MAG: 4a-hydroxytetrahydrobiopterin dehydratase [Candidatus Xiphinematobacter sp.]|nr:MAG: 4a-hydroxytetrahydrobiopterin dehydratase [Candidatus Xiphinematobacter sp.]QQY08429.1 MAG: 4a-hydroxytetrahydrobiopterin dehydratase [Candidatus Xiphinematobacter sp.]QQY09167.1 MAG: 4a-hydroxytetrahydrobiopterin dehydratase [Candidatus Xiphinematobacter sp.]QQY10651.1 MAG: 4a-hydroxytetrahydrobiopterin dehydratase [Candidatus Xiphinematobacter sp.]QQY11393.1 MAG: 4a-hydroxytetrahydrobiopterin dehydratase [Candidatus Xiphinematobacter sp.]
MFPRCLGETEIVPLLSGLPHWNYRSREISRIFQFTSFMQSIDFVNQVAKLSENACHHPEIFISWRKVTLTLSTHRVKGLTALDFDLAAEIDRLFANLPVGSRRES